MLQSRTGLHPDLAGHEFTLDDIVFPPCRLPDFERREVDLATRATRNLSLRLPLISSPMDTVTGADMAILLARLGGIGVIHYNFGTLDEQMEEVRKVRRFEAGFIHGPMVIGGDTSLGQLQEVARKVGFSSFPVTEDGTLDGRLIGMVTNRDVRYQEDPTIRVRQVMTPRQRLVVARREDTLDVDDIRAANKLIRGHNLDTLPVVDAQDRVVGLVTDSDLRKNAEYALATKDANKQLKVLVAVESRLVQDTKERIKMASELGASGIVVDARQIYREHLEIARFCKREAPQMEVILGNVVTREVAAAVLDEAGDCIDAFRVGIGGGEVCITTETTGLGRALGSAIHEVAEAICHFAPRRGHIGLIADGGIKTPLHVVGALGLGAAAVMMGSGLAGFEESPSRALFDEHLNRTIKRVRGMGSEEAIKQRAGANRYMTTSDPAEERFPEGIEKIIPYRGSGTLELNRLFAGVKTALQGLGFRSIQELQENVWIAPRVRAPSKGMLA